MTAPSRGLSTLAAIALGLAACGGGGDAGNPVQHTLSVQKLGNGSGTVTGGGIGCGATCSASLVPGAAVTLTAAADPGSTFAGWTGCDGVAGATCNVTLDGDRAVTATFEPVAVTYVLTVQKSGSGSGTITGGAIGCGSTCSSSVAAGTAVALTATPDAVSTFAGWSGCDGVTGATCNVTMGADRTVTATFEPATGSGSIELVNHHCIAVDQLYVRPSSSPTWSANQLLVPAAANGGTFTLAGVAVGVYDVRAVALDGVSWTTSGIAVTAGGTFTWSLFMPAGTGCLTVVNNTPYTIEYLYDPLSPSGCNGNVWGTERLGGLQILPDATFTLSNVPQGAHDFWARSLTSAVDYRVCGMGVPGGGTFTWYLIPP
jgi:uncharacterized repeat protein (TIGR02543 family)